MNQMRKSIIALTATAALATAATAFRHGRVALSCFRGKILPRDMGFARGFSPVRRADGMRNHQLSSDCLSMRRSGDNAACSSRSPASFPFMA
jgi:hypothetical protein